jgi:hypothetical protein
MFHGETMNKGQNNNRNIPSKAIFVDFIIRDNSLYLNVLSIHSQIGSEYALSQSGTKEECI